MVVCRRESWWLPRSLPWSFLSKRARSLSRQAPGAGDSHAYVVAEGPPRRRRCALAASLSVPGAHLVALGPDQQNARGGGDTTRSVGTAGPREGRPWGRPEKLLAWRATTRWAGGWRHGVLLGDNLLGDSRGKGCRLERRQDTLEDGPILRVADAFRYIKYRAQVEANRLGVEQEGRQVKDSSTRTTSGVDRPPVVGSATSRLRRGRGRHDVSRQVSVR